MAQDAKKKAIAKKTAERFARNPFAHSYSEKMSARAQARHADKSDASNKMFKRK